MYKKKPLIELPRKALILAISVLIQSMILLPIDLSSNDTSMSPVNGQKTVGVNGSSSASIETASAVFRLIKRGMAVLKKNICHMMKR